jgi:uncharacterized protein
LGWLIFEVLDPRVRNPHAQKETRLRLICDALPFGGLWYTHISDAKNLRFRMAKQQDAINKRMRDKLQRRKQLWQKRRSPINGIGLFATLPIRTGTPIVEFKGRVIPWEEGAVMLLRGANHVIKFDARHDMDARPQWSPAGHVNHGCYPNCAIKKKRGGLWLTSIRRIEQDEELLIDYDFELGEEFEPCRCGHPRCRGLMLRRRDWPKLRKLMSKVL